MNDLKIFNSDLIPVYTTDTGEQVVIGRELHDKLGIKRDYSNWFKQMCDYGFEEEKDYSPFLASIQGRGQPKKEHLLKFDMAKHICMIQRTPIGMQIRQKLIELEKQVSHQDSYMIEDPIERAKAWIREQEERKALEAKNKELKPKALFADAVSTSHTTILIGDLAKILKQNGIEIGQKRLFEWLRQHGYLIKRKGSDWNSPTQKAMEMGLFEIKETTIDHPDGHVTISKTTKVTGKGQVYFTNKFLEGAIEDN